MKISVDFGISAVKLKFVSTVKTTALYIFAQFICEICWHTVNNFLLSEFFEYSDQDVTYGEFVEADYEITVLFFLK